MAWATLLVFGFSGAISTACYASRVEIRTEEVTDFVRYVASQGERNDVTFAGVDGGSTAAFLIRDPGATVTAGARCASQDQHAAICYGTSPSLYNIRVRLGDGDDLLRPAGFTLVRAYGGPGNDLLVGGTWDDRLDGGGGRDELRGGEGADVLSDGDRDRAAPGSTPNADLLDGGPGADTLSYEQRMRAVVVDLATGDPVGEPGENDIGTGFESVTGGQGNDRLAGDRHNNAIDGGGGSNLLIGRRGDDYLQNASGRTVRCGRGMDVVTRTRARTRVPPSCESLSVRLPRDAVVDRGAEVSPVPRNRGEVLGLDLSCPEIDGYAEDCRATVRITDRSNHRLLATGRYPGGVEFPRGHFLRLHLTTLGQRLQRDDRRQLAMIVIRGPLMARTQWTVAF